MPGWRVGLIVASFSIGIPDFLNGAHNGLALGLGKAVLAALLACLALYLASCMTAIVSVRTRLSTYLLVQRSFGRHGAALINSVIALIHYCWFGVNVTFFGEAMSTAATANGLASNQTAFMLVGAVLMTISTIIGIRALEKLALVVVPLLALIFSAVVFVTVQRYGIVTQPAVNPPEPMSFGIVISALIGAYMLAVATMPDLTRYVRTARGAVLGMAVSFPIVTPLVISAAAIPALATGETSLMKLVMMLGFGTPVLFLLVLPTWTLNALNLYSASLSLSATFPRAPRTGFIVAGGVIGTLFALAGILDYFIPFLLFLGLIIPPIAAIYVIDAYAAFRNTDPAASITNLPTVRWPALGTWLGSIAVAVLAAYEGLTLTTVPALDATLMAAAVYGLLIKLRVGRMA